jgi:hypothetical protein
MKKEVRGEEKMKSSLGKELEEERGRN